VLTREAPILLAPHLCQRLRAVELVPVPLADPAGVDRHAAAWGDPYIGTISLTGWALAAAILAGQWGSEWVFFAVRDEPTGLTVFSLAGA
jgi:hypothetical protein